MGRLNRGNNGTDGNDLSDVQKLFEFVLIASQPHGSARFRICATGIGTGTFPTGIGTLTYCSIHF